MKARKKKQQGSDAEPSCDKTGDHRGHDRLLNKREVLDRVRHEKSWLHEKIRDGLFPRGHRFVGERERFWWESDVEAALSKLIVPIDASDCSRPIVGKRPRGAPQKKPEQK